MTDALRISADIGGTFTDLVFQDAASGRMWTKKVLSVRQDPAQAVLSGFAADVEDDAAIRFMIHGTTVGLNAVLERRGSPTAILTTRNFRHVYEIAGNDRRDIFNIRYRKPEPLVRPRHVYEIDERILADGSILRPLDEPALAGIVEQLRRDGVESLAVCLLFSYLNPVHEQRVRAYLADAAPDLAVTLSHEVSPEWREYARTSTAVTNAYIAPVVDRYLSTLVGSLENRLDRTPLHVMESNGGAMTARAARAKPIQTLLSGPVGGTIGATRLAGELGIKNLICVDMGGTSFDASLVIDGSPTVSSEAEIAQLPLQMSAVDIHVIGAGGGSVAWLEGDYVRVGPRSAGAEPGPACYGRGGTEPTVTDANLLLGRVDGRRFAGGSMVLDEAAARRALETVGAPMGMSPIRIAEGIVDIINAKMADAIRTITVQRGIDPRDFALLAYGGAGPMHAASLADGLEIATVVVPRSPGTFSAWGMLTTDIRHDFAMTYFGDWARVAPDDLRSGFEQCEAAGRAQLREEGIAEGDMSFLRSVDLRYTGQEYFLNVALPAGEPDTAALRTAFDDAYREHYGHSQPMAGVELVSLRVAAVGRLDKPPTPPAPAAVVESPTRRQVVFGGEPYDAEIRSRESIESGRSVEGPAVIEESSATTVVPPGWAALNRGGTLVVERTAS